MDTRAPTPLEAQDPVTVARRERALREHRWPRDPWGVPQTVHDWPPRLTTARGGVVRWRPRPTQRRRLVLGP